MGNVQSIALRLTAVPTDRSFLKVRLRCVARPKLCVGPAVQQGLASDVALSLVSPNYSLKFVI